MTDEKQTGRPWVPAIRDAQPGDVDKITNVLVEAFMATPDAVWLIPDEQERRIVYGRYSRALLEAALSEESDGWFIHVTDDVDAVAVWQDYVEFETPAPDLYNEILNATCGRYADRFRLLDSVLARHHPTAPHHHLAWLGVRPDGQGHGLGSALLRHAQQSMDATDDSEGVPTYLVAVSAQARDFYERRGYWLYHPAPMFLPDSGPPLWAMWRDPAPAAAAGTAEETR
ncbi:GNAT family N-acetyltransferase [Phytohabitans houttuyneae]|nr:GNAT family N-acetyltransferase [Phytohabitans houttuyneae]